MKTGPYHHQQVAYKSH